MLRGVPMEFCEFGDGIESILITRQTILWPKSIVKSSAYMDLSMEDVGYGAGIESIIKAPPFGRYARPRIALAPPLARKPVEVGKPPDRTLKHPTIQRFESGRLTARSMETRIIVDAFDREIGDYLAYLDFETGRSFESLPAKAA